MYIQWTLDKLGLGDIHFSANHAWFEGRRLHVEFPWASAECETCGNCKRDHLMRCREQSDRIIYIGDGHSDCCPVEHADVVIAKGTLAEHCRTAGTEFAEFRDFRDVIEILERHGVLVPESVEVETS